MDMFGVGYTEILLIAVAALLIYGRDLPEATRKMGRLLGELRRNVDKIKSEFHEDMPNFGAVRDEIHQNIQNMKAEIRGGEEANIPATTEPAALAPGNVEGAAPISGDAAASPANPEGTPPAPPAPPASDPAAPAPPQSSAPIPPPEQFPRSSDDRDRLPD